MITLNTYFTSKKSLKKFIVQHNITDNKFLLIQIFTSMNKKKKIKKLTSFIKKILPNSKLIGATTDGEIKNGLVSTNKTVISFTSFKNTSLQVYISKKFKNYYDAGLNMAKNLVANNTQVIISFIDGLNGNGEEFLNGINTISKTVKVAGGLAGDCAKFKKTLVFTKNKIYKHGVVGVALNSNSLKVHHDYNFHWLPIGKKMTITKSVGNRVYTIDNKPARDIYAYYLGEDIAKRLPAVGIEFPLIIDNKNGVTVARAVLGTKQDGSLIFAGNLKNGDFVRFGYGDSDSILSHTKQNTKNIFHKQIETIFLYSCMARRRFMPNMIQHETMPFNKIAPTSGFFTYGEFFSHSKKELLNQTMTILALSESNINFKNKQKSKTNQATKETRDDTIKALSHLIDISYVEMEKQKEAFEKI